MQSEPTRIRMEVMGRVQGVGFRWFTRDLAERMGIVGWVKNCSDGSVEIEAQGPEGQLRLFADRVHEGPGPGYVRSIQKTKLPLGKETTFTIAF